MSAITIERKDTSRSTNANRRTKPKTRGMDLVWAALKSSELAVWPRHRVLHAVDLTHGLREQIVAQGLERGDRGVLGAVAVERDVDLGDRVVTVDLDLDRPVHLAAGERLRLELGDRLLHRRGRDVVGLDRDGRWPRASPGTP